MGYERPMFFKLKRPQSLDLGLLGIDQVGAATCHPAITWHLSPAICHL